MIRGFIKRQLTRGTRQALRKVQGELRLQRRHKRGIRQSRRLPERDLQLHLGCGRNIKAGWVNIDVLSPKADLALDIREDLPFPDNSAAFIYSEHTFEHLEYPGEAKRLLAESLRVLCPGGRFSVGVPDTEWPLTAYVNGDEQYFRLAREHWHPPTCTTRMHQINYHFRQGSQHKYAYDYETLAEMLTDAGFTDVHRRDFEQGLDSERRRIGRTLYVDGRKPGVVSGR